MHGCYIFARKPNLSWHGRGGRNVDVTSSLHVLVSDMIEVAS